MNSDKNKKTKRKKSGFALEIEADARIGERVDIGIEDEQRFTKPKEGHREANHNENSDENGIEEREAKVEVHIEPEE
jgi:hypothetical protein